MAALQPRHRWMAACISSTFGSEVSDSQAEEFLQHPENRSIIDDLLGGKNDVRKVFVCYCKKRSLTIGVQEDNKFGGLQLSDGTTEPMKGKCCYFLRNTNDEEPVDVSKPTDNQVLYGQLSGEPLKSLEVLLSHLFQPLFLQRENWGLADKAQQNEFKEETSKFTHEVKEAIKSLMDGLQLKTPDPALVARAEQGKQGKSPSFDPEMCQAFMGTLECWCNEIEAYIASQDGSDNSPDAGPLTELEYWRLRMQRLISITQQLKSKQCKVVLNTLSWFTKHTADQERMKLTSLLKRWKNVDVSITESANEAKDNVKYLFTLEKFIEPLYNGDPSSIIDSLPALINSIKMIHTIARYYNTPERMTKLFIKVTNQMINNCKQTIQGQDAGSDLWDKDPEDLVRKLEACLKLNEAYQEQYRLNRDRLQATPSAKQFDFNEPLIFGKFDLFCRRIIKLIDMFTTIHQFSSLAQHKLEGMEELIAHFKRIISEFRGKRHDLLNYHNNKFDRDYVEFNVRISDLEGMLQQFINQSFESITSIEHSLNLLRKFQTILHRENLKSDLDSKFNVIFQNYGQELEQVQLLYEKLKHSPPIPRNLPPVAGNITWSRHLLKRIEEPMKKFESNQNVLASKDAKRIIRMYNKVARTLVAFEYLWYQAWLNSLETAKAGLQATLIIRHPEDGKLYVNFDQEILQLIREAKCLDRMGIEIPESARIILMQEEKFKTHFNELQYSLSEYERLVKKVIPVTAMLLRPHFADMDFKLRPGMVTLTWTSMNIEAYKQHLRTGLQKLEELVTNINDVVENRLEKNLKIVSKSYLVNMPQDQSLSLEQFLDLQNQHIQGLGLTLQGKNQEIETAVEDVLKIVVDYPLDPHVEGVSAEEVQKLKKHYNHFMYQALLHCTKKSLNQIKNRVGTRSGIAGLLLMDKPIFDVELQLSGADMKLHPALEDIQQVINQAAKIVLQCSKSIYDWGQDSLPDSSKRTFFDRITKDIEVVRVVLLLTGNIQGLKNNIAEYTNTFKSYDWLWKDDKQAAYEEFLKTEPELDDFERELQKFVELEEEILTLPSLQKIGPISLNSSSVRAQLLELAQQWKYQYSNNLHLRAKERMNELTEYIRTAEKNLSRDVNDLVSLRFMMLLLREIRQKDSGIYLVINPILRTYSILEFYLPQGFMGKEEMDQKSVLSSSWRKLVQHAEARTEELSRTQAGFKRKLLRDIKEFVGDVKMFRAEFLANGPMVKGIPPLEAVERLTRFKDEFSIRERKFDLYRTGEDLFALPNTEYQELVQTKKELELLEKLFGLYTDVLHTIEEWKTIPWVEVVSNIENMTQKVEEFSQRCRKMPNKLREWEAYTDLKKMLDDFSVVLPLLQELSKDSIRPRHWEEIEKITGSKLDVSSPDFKLLSLLEAKIVNFKEDIDEVTDSADKQLKIEMNLKEVEKIWEEKEFAFLEWKERNVSVLKGCAGVLEELEEAQMNVQTLLTMRHIAPFREEAEQLKLKLLNTFEALDKWLKVQVFWCSLESVFSGGDIAKQLPTEAKKFQKIDKEWGKIMGMAVQEKQVLACCSHELLVSDTMQDMYEELQRCQKSLEGYLEQKRNKFPRFYFVSNPSLLLILSQGSEPLSMNEHYEKVFDAIEQVQHDKKDKTIILSMLAGIEVVPFSKPVKAIGNIEDWLSDLARGMQMTMKDICRNCAADIATASNDIKSLRGFVDNYVAQFALLGIQMMWTADVTTALETCKVKKNAMKEANQKSLQVLYELSSWCLQDLGPKPNRTKIETLVTIHVHQRDVLNDLTALHKQKKISDANDFEWLKQARFYWKANQADELGDDACVISITDVDFTYQFEYLGAKERLVITPLTDRCYITLAQALGMYFGGAPAGPAGTGKTETVKDLGRTLGIFVVVTNCTDQQKYTDCAKIFKGLCQGGLWGCFDEFNRIQLPVLSVVAQQVLAIQNAKKSGTEYFQFPGDPQNILLKPVCGFFITMNPGYAGRQELPENLKALFRGVAMMVPDFEIIMKVKLCSVGYQEYALLAKKFFILYNTCKEQLSAQKHYDWGLRNILAVLRTAGKTKRDNINEPEAKLLLQTLRDMNLSKLVAQDVPLFLSLLSDLFPSIPSPAKGQYPALETALNKTIESLGLVHHPGWLNKVIQFYETTLVRHGIMLVGPSGGGKTRIFECLQQALSVTTEITHKQARLNPKAIRAQEMYGEVDPLSGEWTTGVFAAMWAKYNNKTNKFNTWIICDGPVDAIWIEDLNTVLDDNKILTLANGDRIPMTDNVKLMFEVETLVNASPATVSRAGIVFVSDTDLDWAPVVEAWIRSRVPAQQPILRALFTKYLGENGTGHLMDFLNRNTSQVMTVTRVSQASRLYYLIQGLTEGEDSRFIGAATLSDNPEKLAIELEKIFLYSLSWSLGGLLEPEDRVKFHEYIAKYDDKNLMPRVQEGETIYEYFIEPQSLQWKKWVPPEWKYPTHSGGAGGKLDFSNLLVPTMDSTRALFLMHHLHKQRKPVLLVGGSGTAKTSCARMFFATLNPEKMLVKLINFSSATTPFMFQSSVEQELDKRGGKNFGPPNGKRMTIFLDDLSMPLVNAWGDQPTLEMVRLIIEFGGFCFLDKDKRGDFKVCEDLQYLAAMQHPGGGRNDIPNRLKRQFFIFNLILPSLTSIDDIYGQMLKGRFASLASTLPQAVASSTMKNVGLLTRATIDIWRGMKQKMLPTPSKFHYVFNMRELSRVFQGVLLTPLETFTTGGGILALEKTIEPVAPPELIVRVWKHECDRVFGDKLTNHKDKATYEDFAHAAIHNHFPEYESKSNDPLHMVNFLRDDVYEDGVLVELAPKVYEVGGSLDAVKKRVLSFMQKYNETYPQKKLELVLFKDALYHLLRISRLLEMPRGSALLVGVGGSGKQSLTRLAAFMANSFTFQITLTKTYNINSLMDDLRVLYKSAGHQRKKTTFIFTDSEIKDEQFLEYINSILLTGEVSGLFPKDEILAMTADLRTSFLQQRPGQPDTQANLKQFFIDNVRDNLHVVLCMSPLNAKFPERARKFPGLISGPTIDWFLPWPEEALVAVSQGLIGDFNIECEDHVKHSLMQHMGMVHKMATELCEDYFSKMRRYVYQTPKSYLSFLQSYKQMYSAKLGEVKQKEQRVNLGLKKLIQGAQDVEAMKVILVEEEKKLQKATADTNQMLESLEVSSAQAKKEGEQVEQIKKNCEKDAARIAQEKAACEEDLAKAKPFVDEAETAIDSIKPAHIGEIKKLAKPADIIKLVFDGVLILFKNPLNPIKPTKLNVAKKEVEFFETSFVPYAMSMMGDTNFLKRIQDFGKFDKDKINEETIEFLLPYLELEGFLPAVAKNASVAAEGLCTWVRAMKFYHEASKIVKPKLEALAVAESSMEAATKALAAAEERLRGCQQRLFELQSLVDTQMAEKRRIEEGAMQLQKKMQQASELIGGLAGERERWTEDSNNFADLKKRLVGDCAVACAFVSYSGPFNQVFRDAMIADKFTMDLVQRQVPVSAGLDVINFLVDVGTIGDWNIEGLPTDPLSIQNGILVTRSSRYPLLVDPQGQALLWIKNREKQRMPFFGSIAINDPKLKDRLESAMAEGNAFVVTGVEEEIDPMLDPVLEKQIITKGKKQFITVSDKNMDYNPKFSMYFITRLPNPHFSPELQSKTTVVDFTVTIKGLEEQLLGKVIGKEQKALEDQLSQVLEQVNSNTKSLLQLDADLLARLTSNSGNLLDDEELIVVLGNTKAKAAEVKEKLIAAAETKKSISEKREQFRPVATRGSVLYFSIVETSLINCMYQTSLDQFLSLFSRSMDLAEKAALASKRVANIIDTMTYITYRYVNRGLYEKDKLTFVLLLTMKILVTASLLSSKEVMLLLRGGAALDINFVKRKPFTWISNEAWLNVIELSQSCKFFANLPNEMTANEAMWRRWYEDNEPEQMIIPDYENRLQENLEIGPFLKLLLVRSLRMDRTILTAKQFIKNTPQMGLRYVEPVTDTIDSIVAEMVPETPVIFLLSIGADPTESIETLARKQKKPPPAVVSLGEGQDPVAIKAMNAAAVNGTWVLLQNCELGLGLMEQMEDILHQMKPLDPSFRLFITALPSPAFPLGLLQMSTKVTNEPPAGLQAGLLRSYTVMVDQERLERVETTQWRQLVFNLCFIHSLVQERRKFGPLGWCIPYEFNNGDLSACIMFLEKHLYSGPISWPTVQYMVAEVQYGGKITDNLDRRMFNLYAESFLSPEVCRPDFSYNPAVPIFRLPQDFVYKIPSSESIEDYRAYCASFPEIDSPEIFGLHPNADLTFRVKEVNSVLNTLSATQPKGGGGSGGASREDVIYEKAAELLQRLPEDYNEDDYRAKLQRLGGLAIPLNIFLFQEIQRLQNVIGKVRTTCQQLQMAIKGEVVMTAELQVTLDHIFDAKVPPSWVRTVAGDEFSWILPTLGLWFSSLLARDEQNRTWLNTKRPNCLWLSGFFNPQGMLTAMKQEVTRKHRAQNWALDDVVYHTEVTSFDRVEQVRGPPQEGVYVHGLFLEGGAWAKTENCLAESEPKKLFTPLPVLLVTGNIKTDEQKARKETYGPQGPYDCPCYKYPSRTDRYLVFYVTLKCPADKGPRHWGLRSVALLCNTD